jgi:hypothetical protein
MRIFFLESHVMTRFHFNLNDGTIHTDFVGVELDGMDHARKEAARFSADFLRLNQQNLWIDSNWRMDVTDGKGMILFSVNFSSFDAPALCHARTIEPVSVRAA